MDEQKHLKKRLLFSEARFEAIAQTATDSIVISDEGSSIVFANKKTYEIFGYQENELLGFHLQRLMPEKYRKAHNKGIERFIHSGVPTLIGHTIEIEGLRKDGTGFPLELSLSSWQEEKQYFFAGIIRDITKRKEEEKVLQSTNQELATALQELQRADEHLRRLNSELEKRVEERTAKLQAQKAELQRVNTDLDNFIYTASHDLKAPVANIEGLVSMLHKVAEIQGSPSAERVMALIEQSITKFKRTVADLTEISKAQKNVDEAVEEIYFEEILGAVKEDLQEMITQEVLIKEDLQLKSFFYARANLRSILYNLLSNAIKYRSPHRAVAILISTYQAGDAVVLQVKDNGLGLSASQQAKMFQMFRRMHTHVEGTGIGLYIVKRIVENNGGRIEVESREGEGSAFTIYFRK